MAVIEVVNGLLNAQKTPQEKYEQPVTSTQEVSFATEIGTVASMAMVLNVFTERFGMPYDIAMNAK